MARRGLLLINLGTPAAPTVPAVRRYLREFLWDARVLDINPLLRAILLYGLILPTRPRWSAKAYQSIWSKRGSPLLAHGDDLAAKLARRLGDGWQVELAMRYLQPSIAGALARFRQNAIDRIVVFPLFPHHSAAAWGSAVEKVYAEAGRLWDVPALQVIPPYYDHPAFIEAFATVAQGTLDALRADKVLFSYHGLPERQVLKSDTGGAHCLTESCCDGLAERNRSCYRAQCFASSRALAARLRLPADACETTFQSRLGRIPWIRPYTDERVRALAQSGVRRLAVLCPSFTADCLETLEEIGIRARADFLAHGGEELALVPSLNSEAVWVDAVIRIANDTVGTSTAG